MSAAKRRRAEELIAHAFPGHTLRDVQRESLSPFPNAYVNQAIQVIENSGAAALLTRWRLDDEVAACGRKPHIPMESALVIMLMHIREGTGILFTDMAKTLAYRLTDEQLQRIGITPRHDGLRKWYNRLWHSVERIVDLIDAYPGQRYRIPVKGGYRQIIEARDPEECEKKRLRASRLANQIVRGSVELVEPKLFDRWRGNAAFDATIVGMAGKAGNPRTNEIDRDRRSINYDAGSYVRGGDHNGDAAPRTAKKFWGLELETMTMTANAPGVPADFPLLTVAIDYHRPGAIKLAGQRLLTELQRHEYPAGHVACDRAYMPGALPEEMQGPFLDAGYTAVFDYGLDDFGLQAYYEHAILVMGAWYVTGMPSDLIEAETLHAKALTALRKGHLKTAAALEAELKELKGGSPQRRVLEAKLRATVRQSVKLEVPERRAADDLLEERQAQRATYRLKRKGRIRPDGSQQYFYPDPTSYQVVDRHTGELAKPVGKSTVVIPREAGLKYKQHYLHGSAEWQGWYSLRNTVEGSYSHLKDAMKEDLGNPAKRRKRGNTFAFLAMALIVASANTRKFLDWVAQNHSDEKITPKNRASFGLDAEISAERISLTVVDDPPPIT
ncbi:hypothetical protein [Marisediminicola sp. LYQ85]|uniref:hypothetical protein n=1 Tax=Marisediminicola sp. LYQ85 TaxID=3391062 RepID=UPI00398379BA